MEHVETGYSLEHHAEGTSRHLDAPILRLELAREVEELRKSEPWRSKGHNAKTLVKYPDLRVVLIALNQGVSLGEHKARGRVSIHTLEGHVLLKSGGQVVEIPAGCLVALEGSILHDVEAVKPSTLLLTIAWPPSA